MSTITFDIPAFRLAFPAFANSTTFPDELLQGYWDVAVLYISDNNYGKLIDAARARAINLLTAHLCNLFLKIDAGKATGNVQASSIDKISVTLTPPPIKNDFDFWLQQTPYGVQLLALLAVKSSGGMYYTPSNINARGFR